MLTIALLEMIGIGLFLPILHFLSDPSSRADNQYVRMAFEVVGTESDSRFIIIFGAAIALFFLFKNILVIFFQYLQGRFIFHQEALFGTRLLGSYLARPYAFHLQRNSARLMHNVTLATAYVFQSGLLPFMNLTLELLICLGVISAIFLINPWESIIVVLILSCVLTIYYLLLKNWLEATGRSMHQHGALSKLWVNQG